jgi:Undecaprenyl-phosphate galactose phosphotransferase WbaP
MSLHGNLSARGDSPGSDRDSRKSRIFPAVAVDLHQDDAITSADANNRLEAASPTRASGHPASTIWNATALFFGDIAASACALAVAGIAAYHIDSSLLGTPYRAFEGPNLALQLLLLAGVMVAICGWFVRAGHYTERRPFREDFSGILNALLVGVVISGFVEFAYKTSFSRLWLLLTWLLAAVAIPISRVVVRRALTASETWTVNAVMIGLGRHSASVKELLTGDAYLGYRVTADGSLSDYTKDPKGSLGKRLDKLMSETAAQRVILVPSDSEMPDLEVMIDALNVRMIPYAVVPPINRLPLTRLATQTFLSCDAVLLRVRPGLVSPFSQAVKRIFDVAAALAMLVAVSPMWLIVSLLIMRDGGPIFFAHERIGRGGRVFRCLKFRTMVPDAVRVLDELLACHPEVREEWLRTRKLKSDPRITRIGNFLRQTSIDELPQLVNVLRGDMSIVGPRPVVHQELRELYKGDNSYYLLVRPGLTGLWQISGRNHLNYERRVHLDSWYVRNWTLLGDIIILLRTIPVVISGHGAC